MADWIHNILPGTPQQVMYGVGGVEILAGLLVTEPLWEGSRSGGRDEPHPKPLDDYVAELIRATRNSAHGLIEQLDAEERCIIGVHSGGLPAETPLLAGSLLFGFAAGAEEFCARRWLAW